MDSDSSNTPQTAAQPDWAEIDASVRVPVLFFLYAAGAWLVTATVLGFIAAAQLVQPGFLADCAWTTHGRIVPMARNAFIYGWGFNAAFAVLIWLVARLCRAPAPKWGTTLVGALFWNAGLKLGLIGIMIGHSTGHFLLEMPGYAAALLFVAYGIVGASVMILFSRRREGNLFATQWYGLAALFWFPWLFTIGHSALVFDSMRGTAQAVAAAWYGHNVYALFLAPIALGAIYYLIPKRTGRPISNYGVAEIGFWSYAVFASFGGLATLKGAPVPAWVQTTGISSNYMLLVPLIALGLNFIGVFKGGGSGPAISFIKLSVLAFLAGGIATIVLSTPSLAYATNLTFVTEAMNQLHWYAFASFAFFGAIYFLLPRIILEPWPSGALVAAHFWASVAGAIILIGGLLLAGFTQGAAINDVENYPAFADVVSATQGYLTAQALAYLTLLVGHLAFFVNIVIAIYRACFVCKKQPATAVFANPQAMEVSS
ncbi:MAG: cbb3-type cytochrome c oxidase subunit I [Synoicihabitans sp.]